MNSPKSFKEMLDEMYRRCRNMGDHEWMKGWIGKLNADSGNTKVFIIEPAEEVPFPYIMGGCNVQLEIPEIICRYIGKKDCYGKEIFEDDIVRTNRGRLCRVKWFSSPSFIGWDLDPVETKNPPPKEERLWEDMVVIGNIHDNPELLGNEFYN